MPIALADVPKRTSSPSPSSVGEAQGRIEQARACYLANRHYHGTTIEGKEKIKRLGFDVSRKFGGATASALSHGLWTAGKDNRKVAPSKRYNYLCETGTARVFAVLASMGSNGCGAPAIVRTLGVKQAVDSFEQDPDAVPDPAEMANNPNWRTPDKIPAAHVLNSKGKGKPTKESAKIFRALLDDAGIKVSEDEAGRLLADVQSDSEDDLPEENVKEYQSFWNERFRRTKSN
jgi:hypothetical protein